MRKSKVIFLLSVVFISSFCAAITGVLGGYLGMNYSGLRDRVIEKSEKAIEVVDEESAYIDVVEKTDEAVVSIVITRDLPVYENYYYNPFGDNFGFQIPGRRQVGEEEQQVGAGSGFVVTTDGFIVTNRHVVSDEGANYTVIFSDGERVDARVVDLDPYLDIAILKVEKDNLPIIKLGDSDKIKVGQRVVAIGNALGQFSNSVSAGIISGLSRSITAGSAQTGEFETLTGIIQTDASINPGNSGGPLLDLEGNAIGVNVAVAQQAENIGFAIPINSVKQIVESVEKYGEIRRPYIGVRYVAITEEIRQNNNIEYDHGALIVGGGGPDQMAVVPGSPADEAGLNEGDIILEVNGVKLDENTSLQNEIQKHAIGDEVRLKVVDDGEEKEITVTLRALEEAEE